MYYMPAQARKLGFLEFAEACWQTCWVGIFIVLFVIWGILQLMKL